LGRTGLVRHASIDRRGALMGTVLAAAALVPSALMVWVDSSTHPQAASAYLSAGHILLGILGPFAIVVLATLGAYATASWRKKYLAMSIILGPCTFARPMIATAAAVVAALSSGRWAAAVAIALATSGLLLIEPVMGLRWRVRSELALSN
jgi:hypothetical protein